MPNKNQPTRHESDTPVVAGDEVVARLAAADRTGAIPPDECPTCAEIARELRRAAERHAHVQLAEIDRGCEA